MPKVIGQIASINVIYRSSVVGMEKIEPEHEVTEILSSLQDGLKSIERGMSTLLEDMAADNASFLEELEAALAAAEAVLAMD